MDPLPPAGAACVAGCCIDGQCVCRLGYAGERCDVELRCGIVPEGFTQFAVSRRPGGDDSDGDETCVTQIATQVESHFLPAVACTCVRTGAIAVLRFRIEPASNLFAIQRGIALTRLPLTFFVSAWVIAMGAYAATAIGAACLDRRTRYLATNHPSLPMWLRPQPFQLRRELLQTLCLRTSILRLVFVYPGHTLYTRVQLLHVIVCSMRVSSDRTRDLSDTPLPNLMSHVYLW